MMVVCMCVTSVSYKTRKISPLRLFHIGDVSGRLSLTGCDF